MELTYYLNQANIPQSLIHNQINYGTSYDFAANLNSNSSYVDLDADYIYKNYTIFLTFEKRRHHPQILVSNLVSESIDSYTVGINSTNELFIDFPKAGFSYTFNIKLGNRNCIAVKRNDNVFTIYLYDVISGVIRESDSIAISPADFDDSVGVISLFGSSYILSTGNNSSIRYFSGFVDQMVVISEPIDESLVEVIFQGFRPETKTSTVTSSFTKSDRYGWIAAGIEPNKQYFDLAYQTVDQYLFTGGLPTGAFIAYESGVFGSSTEFVINNTYYTGINRVTTGISVNPGATATYYSGTIPPGVTNYSYSSTVSIHKYSGRMSVSREVSLTNGGNTYRFDYNSAYIAATQSTGVDSSFNSSYYNNFKMDGVYSDTYNLGILYSGELRLPTGYHIPGEYDFAKGAFYVPYRSATTSYFIDGQPEIYGVLDGNYLTITGASPGSYLEYDNTYNYTSLAVGDSNYLEGRFLPRCSRVLEEFGKNINLNSDYFETSTGHMYHLTKKQTTGIALLFVL